MAVPRYLRSLVQARTLAPPWTLDEWDAKRYRAWQRWQRRTRALDRLFGKLLWLNSERYKRELAAINQASKQRIADLGDGDVIGYVDPVNKPKGLRQNERSEEYRQRKARDRAEWDRRMGDRTD